MPSTSNESKSNCNSSNLLQTQTEKPLHYQYLKEFRVDQCPLFIQHKCTQHKPFTCFYWHFNNQRRRRPVRKRDGSFNYSPDVYCTRYDETTGICQDGDDCVYLHRTAGDTERRYHLRYYKTGICVYDTDSRGYCVKNGPHCAFAHGIHDLRNPVYDLRELQTMEGQPIGCTNDPIDMISNSLVGPNLLDKERNALNEDPRWQDTTYVLANYKTELCKRPPRLCRQGYACPQYHNNKDRRRSPKKYKYRSTPCPNVKQGDEWGDPANCEAGDSCPYCHTRTEQQFHPEIYKSTKCNDIQQTNYCPRGPFCAFAHVEKEIATARDLMDNNTDLASLLTNVLPQSQNHGINNSNSVMTTASNSATMTTNSVLGHQNSINANSISGIKSNQNQIAIHQQSSQQKGMQSIASSLPDHFVANYDQFGEKQMLQQTLLNDQHTIGSPVGGSVLGPIARPRSFSTSNSPATPTGLGQNERYLSYFNRIQNEDKSIILNGPQVRKISTNSIFSGQPSPVFGSLTGSSQDRARNLSDQMEYDKNTLGSVIGSALEIENLSIDDSHLEAPLEQNQNQSNDNSDINRAVNCLGKSPGHITIESTAPMNIPGARMRSLDGRMNLSPPLGGSPLTPINQAFNLSPFGRTNSLTGNNISSSANSNYYDLVTNMSPSSAQTQSSGLNPVIDFRLRDEIAMKLSSYEQTLNACEAWKREAVESNRREKLAEKQRDEALSRIQSLKSEGEQTTGGICIGGLNELETLSSSQLMNLQKHLKNGLDQIDKLLSCRVQSSI